MIEETIISPLQQMAIDYCDKKQMPKIGRQIAVIAYMHGAQEERERCIKAAQEVHCLLCPIHNRCELIENGTIGVDTWNRCRCFDRVNIRKAMEGGEE